MADPQLATTLLLLRPAAASFEVFLVQRHRRSGFLPNAWVFPGGRVDPGDRLADHPGVSGADALAAHLGVTAAQAVAIGIAGVRETFEEAGIWLGDGGLPDDARLPLARGEQSLRDLLDAHGATIDLHRLRPWAWWVTPEAEPRRYDTRFFVVQAEGAAGTHDEHETVASGWYAPREVLDGYRLDAFPLAPPTWWTLRELAEHDSIDSVLSAVPWRIRQPIQPVLSFTAAGLTLELPRHEGLPAAIKLADGAWVTA